MAKGLVEALNTLKVDIPIVIRLTGTNEKEGHNILKESKLTLATSMAEAAQTVIKLTKN